MVRRYKSDESVSSGLHRHKLIKLNVTRLTLVGSVQRERAPPLHYFHSPLNMQINSANHKLKLMYLQKYTRGTVTLVLLVLLAYSVCKFDILFEKMYGEPD